MTDNAIHLLDGIEGLRSLPCGSVDMLLTDLPYGTTENYWDVPISLPQFWDAVEWAVKPSGAVLIFAQCPYDKTLGVSNLKMLRYEWIWYKDRGTGFLNAKKMPLKKSENILVFYKSLPTYNPQFEYREPYLRTDTATFSKNYGKYSVATSESLDGKRYPGNVVQFPSVNRGIHPTQKPLELCEYFIKTYTNEGELVADVCAGSGTTAVACVNTDRRYICFENSPHFYTLASERVRKAVEQKQ